MSSKELRKISFAENYSIDEDGNCYSSRTDRYLKRRVHKSKNKDKLYYSYDFSMFGKHLINRLVMFAFGDHNYIKIEDMPRVISIDGDLSNTNINNLKFATRSEICIINNQRPNYIKKSGIPLSDKIGVEEMLKNNFTYKSISEVYKVSEMTVYRFIKKHNLK